MKNEQSEALSERDEIEALLPWYLADRLDQRERVCVERYLEVHPEMQAHLVLAREELEATIAGNEAVSAPGPQALERLRRSIAAQHRQTSPGLLEQIGERFRDWLAEFTPPQLAYAAAIAAFVVALQAALLGALVLERINAPAYQTAGGEENVERGVELLVTFSESATMGEIDALLKRVNAVVVDGPKAGLYRLRLPGKGAKTQKAAIEALQHSGLVTLVLPGR
jgi:anti-sigma factor RsiW